MQGGNWFQQGKKLGRPKVAEDRGRHQKASERRQWHPQSGSTGWCGSGTVQRVKREMVGWMAGGLNVRAWIKPSET